MSHLREDNLTNLQNDLLWPLRADEYFADLNVIDYRKEQIAEQIEQFLTLYKGKAGKIGAAVIALPLSATDKFVEATASHPLQVRATYRVLEHPMFNMGSTGTKKPALSICSRIRRVLKHYIFGGFAVGFTPDGENFIVPVEDPIAPVAYDVNFVTNEAVDQSFFKVANPVFHYDTNNAELQITCETPDVTLYYTLDGSFPWSNATYVNAAVQTYTTALTMEGEWFIRAVAVKESHVISNVHALRSSEIGNQEGGALGLIS